MDLFRSVKMTEMILAVTDIKNPKVDFTDYNKLILEFDLLFLKPCQFLFFSSNFYTILLIYVLNILS